MDIFHIYTDDTSELSSVEELALLNRIYKQICRQKPWEFLKTEKTGTLSASVPYVALPTDFQQFSENNQSTENTTGASSDIADRVVFVGTQRTPYKIVNFSDRNQYYNKDGYCYLDFANQRLVFTLQPSSALTYSYDYIKTPADLTLATSPVFTVANEIIAFGMATDSYIIQIFDKARSYAPENNAKYTEGLADLSFYNANLRND